MIEEEPRHRPQSPMAKNSSSRIHRQKLNVPTRSFSHPDGVRCLGRILLTMTSCPMYKNFEHQVNGGGLLGTGKHPICSHHEETGSPAPLGPVQPTKTGKKKKKKKSKGSTRLQPT